MKQHSRRSTRLFGLIVLVVLGLALLPQHTNAAVGKIDLADQNDAWNRGQFFRTGLAQIGGVQLVPQNIAKQLKTTNDLPAPVSSHSSVTYGDQIFVVGGDRLQGGQSPTLEKTSSFFVGRLTNPQTGELTWKDYTITNPLPQPLAKASALIVELSGQPYLFVLGGQISFQGNVNGVSTSTIYYTRLQANANGDLVPQTWKTASQPLPHQEITNPNIGAGGGAYGMSAAVVTVNGVPNIYIFGGFNRLWSSGFYSTTESGILSDVYRTRVVMQSGEPSLIDWTISDQAVEPVSTITQVTGGVAQPSAVKLYGAAASQYYSPELNTTAVYLVGGTKPAGANSTAQEQNAYIAAINNATGAVTWLETGNMSAARSSHAGLISSRQILVSGGTANPGASPSEPDRTMGRGFINDDLTLYTEQAGTANFVLEVGALLNARMDHTMETIQDTLYGRSWYYVIGGQRKVDGGALEQATKEVLVGDVNAPPLPGDKYVSTGRYYSRVFDFGDNTEFYDLLWTARMTGAQQITLQYRTGNTTGELYASPWSTAATSVDGASNLLAISTAAAPKTGRYFQFLATLNADPGQLSLTPILDLVSLRLKRDGFPNPQVNGLGAVAPNFQPAPMPFPVPFGTTVKPNATLTNKAFDTNYPVLDTDWETPNSGSFYVDMYVTYTPSGQTPAPSKPVFGQTQSVAYVNVEKRDLKADRDFIVPSGNWQPAQCAFATTAPCGGGVAWDKIFNIPGTYSVYLMVDSVDPETFESLPPTSELRQFGQVKESDAANTLGETDNIYGPFTVTVVGQDGKLYLPIGYSKTAAAATSAQRVIKPAPRTYTDPGVH